MKRAPLLFLLALVFSNGLVSCKIADLRTPDLLELQDRPKLERKGRQLLAKAEKVAGGRMLWESFDRVDLFFGDEWQGFLGWLFRPWPYNPCYVHMRYELGMKSVETRFLQGSRKGTKWGVKGGKFWTQKKNRPKRFYTKESARFILQAYQYFFELPFQISQADVVLYAGQRKIGSKVYDLVFATWGTPAPHSSADQYLLWIARDTGCLEIAQYTIRDKFNFATGINRFSDFRRVQGLLLPHRYWIASSPEDTSFIHQARLSHLVFHPRRSSPQKRRPPTGKPPKGNSPRPSQKR